MLDIDDYREEKSCVYKGEEYLVRDNGAVLRKSQPNKKTRKLDNEWTFGKKNSQKEYLEIAAVCIHHIVALAFHGEPPTSKHIVYHIDENKKNNAVENLEWATPKENVNYGTAIARQIKTQGFPVFILFPDGTKKDFDSIAQAARFLGVQKGSATHAYHKHKKLKGVEIVGKFDS